MHASSLESPIQTSQQFEENYRKHVRLMLGRFPVKRGPAHATTDETMAETYELMHVTDVLLVDQEMSAWQATVNPNLPWAEDHFQERVSGKPLNPAPSEAWWPFARQGNAEHKREDKFSHTYPERFWPKHAEADSYTMEADDVPTETFYDTNQGIRFRYGDLNDLIEVLQVNQNSRQAYLPIWFPEDLAASVEGERVPCSMGYHLIRDPSLDVLDCVYTMRSCDIVRFYRDDIYMAGRLLQWVAERVDQAPGRLVVHIDNLHCFPGDRPILETMFPSVQIDDRRAGYNFEGLY